MNNASIELLTRIIENEFEKFRLNYEFEETLVVSQADSKSIRLPGMSEIPIEKGKIVRIYRGLANQLVELGLAKFCEEPLAIKDIATMRWLESSEDGLVKLPDHFYLRAARLISSEKSSKKSEALNDLQEIIDIRLRKIFKLVFLKGVPGNLKLQPEENFLYRFIREALNIWRRELMYGNGEQ
ncbi:MAG: hypothetical protein ACUVQ0_05645 [Thermoproteota archaeon]